MGEFIQFKTDTSGVYTIGFRVNSQTSTKMKQDKSNYDYTLFVYEEPMFTSQCSSVSIEYTDVTGRTQTITSTSYSTTVNVYPGSQVKVTGLTSTSNSPPKGYYGFDLTCTNPSDPNTCKAADADNNQLVGFGDLGSLNPLTASYTAPLKTGNIRQISGLVESDPAYSMGGLKCAVRLRAASISTPPVCQNISVTGSDGTSAPMSSATSPLTMNPGETFKVNMVVGNPGSNSGVLSVYNMENLNTSGWPYPAVIPLTSSPGVMQDSGPVSWLDKKSGATFVTTGDNATTVRNFTWNFSYEQLFGSSSSPIIDAEISRELRSVQLNGVAGMTQNDVNCVVWINKGTTRTTAQSADSSTSSTPSAQPTTNTQATAQATTTAQTSPSTQASPTSQTTTQPLTSTTTSTNSNTSNNSGNGNNTNQGNNQQLPATGLSSDWLVYLAGLIIIMSAVFIFYIRTIRRFEDRIVDGE